MKISSKLQHRIRAVITEEMTGALNHLESKFRADLISYEVYSDLYQLFLHKIGVAAEEVLHEIALYHNNQPFGK